MIGASQLVHVVYLFIWRERYHHCGKTNKQTEKFETEVQTKPFYHYSNVIMSAIASQIIGVSIVCSNVCLGADQGNINASCHWPCAGNSSVTGGFPSQRASDAENLSIWWRHRATPTLYVSFWAGPVERPGPLPCLHRGVPNLQGDQSSILSISIGNHIAEIRRS